MIQFRLCVLLFFSLCSVETFAEITDPYIILGVKKGAKPSEVVAAYADRLHLPLTPSELAEVSLAFGILGNKERRAAYDERIDSNDEQKATLVRNAQLLAEGLVGRIQRDAGYESRPLSVLASKLHELSMATFRAHGEISAVVKAAMNKALADIVNQSSGRLKKGENIGQRVLMIYLADHDVVLQNGLQKNALEFSKLYLDYAKTQGEHVFVMAMTIVQLRDGLDTPEGQKFILRASKRYETLAETTRFKLIEEIWNGEKKYFAEITQDGQPQVIKAPDGRSETLLAQQKVIIECLAGSLQDLPEDPKLLTQHMAGWTLLIEAVASGSAKVNQEIRAKLISEFVNTVKKNKASVQTIKDEARAQRSLSSKFWAVWKGLKTPFTGVSDSACSRAPAAIVAKLMNDGILSL